MTPPPLPDDAEQETMPFNCPVCFQQCTLSVDMVGKNIECPTCKEKVKVPAYSFSINPFQRPIQKILNNLRNIRWRPPFFPNIVEALVLIFVALVTIGLYITIGIASQISVMFMNLMLDARQEIKTGSLTEKSAYAVAGGIYSILFSR
jgi:hypothetical protein